MCLIQIVSDSILYTLCISCIIKLSIYLVLGWSKFHDYCYKPISNKETWIDAEQKCQQNYGSNLAHIETQRHLGWMWQLADREPFWIGKESRTAFNPLQTMN